MICNKKFIHVIGATVLAVGTQNCGRSVTNQELAQYEGRQLAANAAVKSFALAEAGSGKTYYVDVAHGADSNSGTSLSSSWKTLAKAANIAVAGDTVYIRGGTYRERLAPKNSGNSSGGYITFAAYNDEVVTLDGSGFASNWGGIVDLTNRSYIQVMGLRATNFDYFGFLVQSANHIKILGNYTNNTGRSGVYAKGSDTVTVDGNEISNANYELNQESLSITDGTTNFVVSNNTVHGGKMEGIDIKGGANNGKVISNIVYNTARIGIYVDGFVSGVHDVVIEGNIVRDPNLSMVGAGMDGIRVGAEAGGLVNNILIKNNVIYNQKAAGIMLPSFHHADSPEPRYSNITIVNNTVYKNGSLDAGGIVIQECQCSSIIIANNIVSENNHYSIRVDSSVQSKVTVTKNLIDKPDGQKMTEDEILGSGYVMGDPQFVDVASRNFHLKSTSPAIDSGASGLAPDQDFDGTLRPQGSGDDIGAFEFKVSGPAPAPLPSPSPTASPSPTPTGDTQAPTVAITSPAIGTKLLSNSWVKFTASASDNVRVTKVEFYVNSVLKCTQATAPYACGYPLPAGAGRTYTVKAKAYDAAGNVATSAAISYVSR